MVASLWQKEEQVRRRALDKGWREFAGWCERRRLSALPAHPWTVAAYARWCEPRQRFEAIAERLKAIARVHVLKGMKAPDRHPTVKRTLRLIERRGRNKGRRAALFREADFIAPDKGPPAAAVNGNHPRRPARSMRAKPKLVARRPGG